MVEYFFQPIVNFKDNSIFGYEALLRPSNMSIQDYLEKNKDNLYNIEFLTWFYALESFKERKLKGKIFVNSFPSTSLTDKDFSILADIYDKDTLSNIVIEILENPQLDLKSLNLKKTFLNLNNGLIALDDFGTGNNNFSMIDKIRPDIIKLDRCLIQNIDIDFSKQKKLSNIINHIKDIDDNILLLSEGIETMGEYNYLKNITDLGQGFYIGKPEKFPNIKLKD